MNIRLSDHFNYKNLIRFTLPSVVMMVLTSVYGVVDGLFVSNFVGKTAFASINLIMPFLMVLGGVGAMLGVGGSALVAKTLGMGEIDKANRYFTMMIYLMGIVGVIFSVIGIVFVEPVSYFFGATENMIDECVLYGRAVLIFNAPYLMQYSFQSFLVVAERPKLGLLVTVAAGVTNMLLDALFIVVFKWGIVGAALATGLSQTVGGVVPLIWFMSKRNNSQLHLTKTGFEIKPITKACTNGVSEMLSSVSGSITGVLYNRQLIKYAGEDGVAAYGVAMYAAFLFIAVFIGFSSGSAPIISYNYGAQNSKELKNVMAKSIKIIVFLNLFLTTFAVALAYPISYVFVGYNQSLLTLTTRAFVICAVPFLLLGFNIYTSSFFTALNDGGVSAIISSLRSLVFPTICIIVMPMLFGLDGVWFSLLAGEILSFAVSLTYIFAKRKKYNY